MDEATLVETLSEALFLHSEASNEVVDTRTFENAGVLTGNQGLVVYVDGKEFQVTVVQSKG